MYIKHCKLSSYKQLRFLEHFVAGTGVWTTPDPIGIFGGLNLYGYVGNNPLGYRDILGLGRDPDDDGYNDCCGTETEGDDDSESDNEYENSWKMPDIVVTAEREDGFGGENNEHDLVNRLEPTGLLSCKGYWRLQAIEFDHLLRIRLCFWMCVSCETDEVIWEGNHRKLPSTVGTSYGSPGPGGGSPAHGTRCTCARPGLATGCNK